MPGTVYIVATPIGNLEDITFRAVRVLKEAQVIAAEDTRQTAKLCERYGITAPLVSYYEFNKEQRTPELINRLKNGENVAVVSDAGTPGISDPAFYLVREAIRNDIPVVPIPGATASIAALVASGLPTDRFVFEGFFPQKPGKRRSVLARFKDEERTVIFFESPYRLVKALYDIREVLGEVWVVVGRELTKKFEEIVRGKTSQVIAHFEQKAPQGEIVLLVNCRAEEKFFLDKTE
jgi:16S rRNA (cytidine1402-2'-O)-methyltransferase